MLRLINLPKSQYTLRIDDKVIASFSKEQLAAGVNLALYATPMENQAKDVEGIELKRAQLDQANFILTIDDPKATSDAAATAGHRSEWCRITRGTTQSVPASPACVRAYSTIRLRDKSLLSDSRKRSAYLLHSTMLPPQPMRRWLPPKRKITSSQKKFESCFLRFAPLGQSRKSNPR